MKDLAWYWHRLGAMTAREVMLHVRKKLRQRVDGRGLPDWSKVGALGPGSRFPVLASASEAPAEVREAVRVEAAEILAGRWTAFSRLKLQVDDPPRWHKDYLAGREVPTLAPAFGLNHRALPEGADVKLIWELSRWYALVRLAQASWVLGDAGAAGKCLDWLEDWVARNPPCRGWNWTSALEVGMRLIQFTWIDALLEPRARVVPEFESRLAAVRRAVLPAHVWFAWRYRSFGSSANNHLLGEIAGLALAILRWPALSQWAVPIDEIQSCWESETLAQFAPDGGNREQALNYQLFSFEFCWQVRQALRAADRRVPVAVEERLSAAARFFWEVQVRKDPWDYGDSDSAFVTPVCRHDASVVTEWWHWMSGNPAGDSIRYWMGAPPEFAPPPGRGEAPGGVQSLNGWRVYRDSGIALRSSDDWWLRWDLSPLGYLKTAAHGHLDSLHLTIWLKGVALVVDPGTGAYYADRSLRTWLASRAAHNGPVPVGVPEHPRRLGPFLWERHHARPDYIADGEGILATQELPGYALRRRVLGERGRGWRVEDACIGTGGSPVPFTVRWQFAPGTEIHRRGEREFVLHRGGESMTVRVGASWAAAACVELDPAVHPALAGRSPEGLVSPAFRQTEPAPYLLLTSAAPGEGSCVFTTTFLASTAS
jgi:hypothetical protein